MGDYIMAKLILTFNKRVIQEYPFDKDSMTIGRKPENDIQIDNLAVSGHHAKIDKTGVRYILTDLQSTNGTYIKNQRVTSHTLTHGDHIQIGKHVLLFQESMEEGAKAAKNAEMENLDKTMILDTPRQRELIAEQIAAAKAKEPQKVGVLTFLNGSMDGEIELTKKLTRMGKSPASDIRLSGLRMGSTAATISRRPSGYTITFAGGGKKLRVNGRMVEDSVPLKDFDTIEIGPYKCQFYQKDIE
jgi:pSer/pThr/pTyr-binding forkhead associated (FHA) protein